jgi:hypothetical protein
MRSVNSVSSVYIGICGNGVHGVISERRMFIAFLEGEGEAKGCAVADRTRVPWGSRECRVAVRV